MTQFYVYTFYDSHGMLRQYIYEHEICQNRIEFENSCCSFACYRLRVKPRNSGSITDMFIEARKNNLKLLPEPTAEEFFKP
jgi:hypothetical protein